jgi:hypothetical protein
MTLIENMVYGLVNILYLLSPVDNLTVQEQLQSEVYPHVYIVPQQELALAVCGCPCNSTGIYLGKMTIDNVTGYTIVVYGTLDGLIPLSNYWYSSLYHELVHHRQDLLYNFVQYNDLMNFEKGIRIMMHDLVEKDAYFNQNYFNFLLGIEDVRKEYITNSVQISFNEVNCGINQKLDEKDRPDIVDLIRKYNQSILALYRTKY